MPKVLTVVFDPEKLAARCRELLMMRSELAARARCSRMTVWQAARGIPIGVGMARRLVRALRSQPRELLVSDNVGERAVQDGREQLALSRAAGVFVEDCAA
ncbi:MAG TPA: hypothetical protein VM487_07680 [Phycisphaerae bacterium]|nr:hypothetical protein [Phycisphaerae bacterium]